MTIADSSMVAATTTALAEVTAVVIGDKGGFSAILKAVRARSLDLRHPPSTWLRYLWLECS
jgi:hypothetical protein